MYYIDQFIYYFVFFAKKTVLRSSRPSFCARTSYSRNLLTNHLYRREVGGED